MEIKIKKLCIAKKQRHTSSSLRSPFEVIIMFVRFSLSRDGIIMSVRFSLSRDGIIMSVRFRFL
jgi:hypothetical protein